MDQKPHDGEQIAMESLCQDVSPVVDKSCLGTSTPLKKSDILGIQHFDTTLVSPTPEKTAETINVRSKKESAKLPEKYRTLSEFFDRMTTSLRLLSLHKGVPTFQNIRRQVETLTGRKFSYRHLAQIKFILPEAVQTDKILLQNKKTLCMEPDVKVTLLFDVVQGHIEHSAYKALCHTFSDRLFKFIATHSEGCDVSEAELPEPYNKNNITISAPSLTLDSSTETLPNIDEAGLFNPSHLHPSFDRHFARKNVTEETEKSKLSSSPVSPRYESTTKTETGFSSCLDPEKQEKSRHVTNEDTPMKPASEPHAPTVETPALSTPKRSMPQEDKLKSVVKEPASNMLAKRVLDFSKTDNEESLFAFSEEKIANTSKNCLSDVVDVIHNIFQSAHCSSLTKDELVHKMLVNSFDVVEIGEIEEKIELLENKVPEWISRKVAPSGDVLYNVNKGLDLKSITEKLM